MSQIVLPGFSPNFTSWHIAHFNLQTRLLLYILPNLMPFPVSCSDFPLPVVASPLQFWVWPIADGDHSPLSLPFKTRLYLIYQDVFGDTWHIVGAQTILRKEWNKRLGGGKEELSYNIPKEHAGDSPGTGRSILYFWVYLRFKCSKLDIA